MKSSVAAVVLIAAFLLLAGCSSDRHPTSPSDSGGAGALFAAGGDCLPIDVIYSDDYPDPTIGGVKDFTIIRPELQYHIFHIADPRIGWQNGGEKEFVHATSNNFIDWTRHARIDLKHSTWSGTNIWSPHVIEEGGTYYMFYTGVEWSPSEGGPGFNWQRIGLATSTDLFNWTLHNTTGLVLDGPWYTDYPWSTYGTPGVAWQNDCRDPFVYKNGSEYVMFVSIKSTTTQMAIAIAKSTDLTNWTWSHHLPVTLGAGAESANLVVKSGKYYLMWTTYWGGSIKIASADDIDGPYTLETHNGLYPYANETMLDTSWRIYGAIVGDFDLQFKKIKFHPGYTPVASTYDFTSCDFFIDTGYDPHDPPIPEP